jgi:NADH:ubiquinone oxidoreductase subunit K
MDVPDGFCVAFEHWSIWGALPANAVAILMGVELMLNAVNINLVAFWRYNTPDMVNVTGQIFAAFLFVVAAAEVAVGLAIVISVYRNRDSVIVEDIDLLRW